MRGREMDESPLGSDSEAPSPSPPPRIPMNLSSMVVKPSASSGGGSDLENGYAVEDRRRDSPAPLFRHGSPHLLHRRVSPVYGRRRGGTSPMHRRESPDAFRRRVPQFGFRRRGSNMAVGRRGPSPPFHPRSQRFHDNRGYMQRAGSISPPHRPRMDDDDDDGYYEPYHDRPPPGGPRPVRGMRGRRGSRFRGVSPPPGHGRLGFDAMAASPERDSGHRNDPNLSPREGDWICQNPSCGNLNFARRTYCNNCNKCRYDEPYAPGRSPPPPPRREYLSPPRRGFLPRREFGRYRSPPRGWEPDDPRELGRRGTKFVDRVEFRERGRSGWLVGDDRSPDRGSPPSSRYGWVRRSRSPMGGRLLGDSFGTRDRYGGSYAGSPRAEAMGSGHGRGYRHDGGGDRPHMF